MTRVLPVGGWFGATPLEAWLDLGRVDAAWYEREASSARSVVLALRVAGATVYVQPERALVEALGLRGLPPAPAVETGGGRAG